MPSEIEIRTAPLPAATQGTLVIYAADGAEPAGGAADIFHATGLDWAKVVETTGFKGKPGHVVDLVTPGIDASRLLVLGSGKPAEGGGSPTAWADRGGSLAAKLMALKVADAAVLLEGPEATPANVAELAAGLKLRHYRFDKYKSPKKDDTGGNLAVTLYVADPAATDAAIANRMAVADGTIRARNLVNEPANTLGTVEVAAEAEKLRELGVEVEVLDEPAIRALGMGALLAIAQGSDRPPRVVVMQWKGAGDAQPVAFIGKGVVFDTGGYSIKTAQGMEDMKGDMAGSAAVIGLMQALATRKARVNAIGVVGLVENMISGHAVRPGDVVKAMSGTTIEVLNTDAEGRLVLADCLWYTKERFKPRVMVNLATLTGAIIVALGHEYAGLFSNNDELAGNLLSAGYVSGEKLWRMPLGPAYEKLIESKVSDIKNSAGRPGSSITAAEFLHKFVGETPWAHLDIAGMAMAGTNTETNTSWGSGFGVALLDRLVRDSYEQK